jgi:DNA-binding NarL/FixJ family response regulator
VTDPAPPDPLHALTAREREVFALLMHGEGNREIAARLVISVKTVETHRAHIFHKLGVHDLAALTRWACVRGLVTAG